MRNFAHSEVFHVANFGDHILRLFIEWIVRWILLQIGDKCILVQMILCLVDSLASTMHAYFDFLGSGLAQVLLHSVFLTLQRHSCFHRQLQLFPRVFNGFFELNNIRIDKADAYQPSCVVQLPFFDCPFFAFLFVELLLRSLTTFLATYDLASMLLAILSAAPRTMYTCPEVFLFNIVNFVNPVQASDSSRSPSMFQQSLIRRSCNTSEGSYLLPWSHQCTVVELGMILLSAHRV